MYNKCPHCNKVPYPVQDENKKIIWKNVFHIDWIMIVIVIILIFTAWAYKHDTEACRQMISDPCSFIVNKYDCNTNKITLSNETSKILKLTPNTTVS